MENEPSTMSATDNTNTTGISDLPLEVLTYIFEFLPYSDMKDVRLVNKLWYKASLDSKCVRNEVMCLDDRLAGTAPPTDAVTFPDYHGVSRQREFKHLNINRCKQTNQELQLLWSNKEFWSRFGPHLQSLTINGGTIKEEHFFSALSYCTGLKSLVIQGRFVLKRIRLTTLPDFDLPGLSDFKLFTRKFDRALCDGIVTRAPYLEVIEMKTPEYETCMHWWTYLLANTNPHLIHVLRVVYYGNDDEIQSTYKSPEKYLLKQILQMPNVRVEEFSSSSTYASDALSVLSDLKRIVLRRGHEYALRCIYEKFPNVESLTLWHRGEFNSNLSSWSLLENLTSLELDISENAYYSDVLGGLCREKNVKLKNLQMRIGCYLSEDGFVRMMKCHPALRRLKVVRYGYCGEFLSDWSFQAISKYQECLEELDLEYSTVLTDAALSGKAMEREPYGENFILNPTGNSILRLKSLRKLRLAKMRYITGSSFEEHFKFPSLREVIFYDVRKLSEDGLKSILKNNGTIEVLDVDLFAWNFHYRNEGCNVFPDGVTDLIKKLRRLRRLRCKVSLGVLQRWNTSKRNPEEFQLLQEHFGTQLRFQLHHEDDADYPRCPIFDDGEDEEDQQDDDEE